MNDRVEKEERTWAMLCHLGSFGGHFIPFGNIIIPLVIWLIKKEESPFVEYHGKESLNFQITLIIYFAIAFALAFVLIGFALFIPLWIFGIVMVIIATIKTNDGNYYRYPFTIRILK